MGFMCVYFGALLSDYYKSGVFQSLTLQMELRKLCPPTAPSPMGVVNKIYNVAMESVSSQFHHHSDA